MSDEKRDPVTGKKAKSNLLNRREVSEHELDEFMTNNWGEEE